MSHTGKRYQTRHSLGVLNRVGVSDMANNRSPSRDMVRMAEAKDTLESLQVMDDAVDARILALRQFHVGDLIPPGGIVAATKRLVAYAKSIGVPEGMERVAAVIPIDHPKSRRIDHGHGRPDSIANRPR